MRMCVYVHAPQVEEVLLLWDRVIGLDSLFPVAVLAVAVLCFRYGAGGHTMLQNSTHYAQCCRMCVCMCICVCVCVCVCVFFCRRQVLLSCAAANEVHEAMADLSQLQTVPLLQAVLFQG